MKKSLLLTAKPSATPMDPFGDGSGVSYFLFDTNTVGYNGIQTIGGGTGTLSTSVKKHGAASLDLTSNVWYSGNSIPSTFRIVYTNAITVTFWVYINSQQNGSPINYNYDGNSRHSFNITSGGVTQLTNYNGSSYNTVHGATLGTGSWHFIANRIQGNGSSTHSTMTLNVDSTKYTTNSSTGSIGAWITRGIGRDANAGYFNGYMDTLRAFNRILTDAEVDYIRLNDPIT